MKTTLFNGRVIAPDSIINGGIVIENDKIVRVFRGSDFESTDTMIDCKGNYIAPGFVDIHTHSTVRGDVMDATVESLHRMTEQHAGHGTTSLVATTLSSTHEKIAKALDNVKKVMALPPAGARVLGAHLEGNYFAPAMAGAQNPQFLYPPASDDYMDFIDRGCVRRVAAAPELPGALEMARKIAPMGIQFSIGHSNGNPSDVEKAIEAGYTSLTHIFNAQSAITSVFCYPECGVSEASLLHDELTVECICDGNHLSPTLLKLIYKIKGADKMVGITDSVYAGAEDGDYMFGGLEVQVRNNICILKNGSAFAGSVATMDLCARTLHKKALIPIADAVRICSGTPAKLIGEDHRLGSIKEGYDADINVFDDDINILYTMILGSAFKNELPAC
jgi:N-acetylglucosamine-6-phosphate deacetylase